MEVFCSDLFLEVTIRELSKRSGLSYNATHRTIQFLAKNDLILLKKFGQASAVSLNQKNTKLLPLLAFAAYEKAEKGVTQKKWEQAKTWLDDLHIRETVSIVFAPDQHPPILLIADSPVLVEIKKHYDKAILGKIKLLSFEEYKKIHKSTHLIIKGAEQLFSRLLT